MAIMRLNVMLPVDSTIKKHFKFFCVVEPAMEHLTIITIIAVRSMRYQFTLLFDAELFNLTI